MSEGLIKTGVISEEEFKRCKGLPSEERIKKGPVAFLECIQDIPCNPCELACKYGAITVGNPITNPPALDEDKCIGCGQCIAKCPGLAIFLEDHSYSETEALVAIPYEYRYLPQKGHKVHVVSREGKIIGTGMVERVVNIRNYDKTIVLYLKVDKSIARQVRGIDFRGGQINE